MRPIFQLAGRNLGERGDLLFHDLAQKLPGLLAELLEIGGVDAIAAQLHAKGFGPGAQREFRRAIERQPGERELPGHRAHIHDDARAPRAHVRRRQLRHAQRREEIQLPQAARLVHGH